MEREDKHREPLISVLIPVYNVEKYLGRCIDSVTGSHYRNLEIICVNDGSSDSCLQILREYEKKDNRVIVIDQINQGLAVARITGLSHASGDYIAMIDSDDYIHPEYFQSMMKCMREKKADIVLCGCQKFSDDQPVITKPLLSAHYRRLTGDGFFRDYYARHMVWGRIYRREVLEGLRFHPGVRRADDMLFNLAAAGSLERPAVYKTDAEMYYYYMRDSSIIHTTKNDTLYDIVRVYLLENDSSVSIEHPWSWMKLMQIIKMALACSYLFSIEQDDPQINREINRDLKKLTAEMNRSPYIGTGTKRVHTMMAAFPALYRQFRLFNDPTLHNWEKAVRQS